MTPDQLQKLRDRAELLVDIFLEESDPTTWPGNGVPVAEMSKQVRGDRYWCKKNAVATLAAAHRVSALVELEMRLASGQGAIRMPRRKSRRGSMRWPPRRRKRLSES